MKRKLFLVFILIVFLASWLRLYKGSTIPVSLYWDETAVAYNAYSIFQTARDEYGNFLPLIFRSFNDYKMPGFVYLTAPFVGILGLNEFAVRLPSIAAGVFLVILTYLLVLEIFKRKRLALLSAFLLSISPWHLQFSRTGFEANVASTIFLAGLLLFLYGIRNRVNIIWSFIVFAISCYFYRSIHGFLPFFLLALIVIYHHALLNKKMIKSFVCGAITLIIIVLPIFSITVLNKGSVRFQQVSITTNPSHEPNISLKKTKIENGVTRYALYAQDFIGNYLAHFSPQFLFISGDQFARHNNSGMGLMYIIEAPFLILGILLLVRDRSIPRAVKWFLLFWALFAPIPAAIATPSPHALRFLNVLPLPQIIVGYALTGLLSRLINWQKKAIIFATIIGVVLCVGYYLRSYYLISSNLYSSIWADGYKQLTQYVFANENKYDKVLITGHYWQPYIYFLLYKKYPPELFQRFGTPKGFDKYVFGPTGWDEGGNRLELENVSLKDYTKGSRVLVALSPAEWENQKDNLKSLTEIKNHNDQIVFLVGETR